MKNSKILPSYEGITLLYQLLIDTQESIILEKAVERGIIVQDIGFTVL